MATPGMQGIGSGAASPAGFPMPGGMSVGGMPGKDCTIPALVMHIAWPFIVDQEFVIAICRLAARARVWHATTRRIYRRHELG